MKSRPIAALVALAVVATLAAAGSPGALAHEWCEPDTLNTYGPSSPVILNVRFNTIDRSSPPEDKELYVHTLESTELDAGSTYPFSMTYLPDPAFCPQYAIRVWIDWDQDESFDTPGDEVISVDGDSTGTITGEIEVPLTAAAGLTRMRVALKMESLCGHTPIAACPEPEDFGWHGEIEDYNVIILVATESDCSNGIDDDSDGAIDCLDPDCTVDPVGDCDGDGVPNDVDCAPADGGAFESPAEIAFLGAWREGPEGVMLEWMGLADGAGADTLSDVVSGTIGSLPRDERWTSATCLLGGSRLEALVDERPAPGASDGHWYLVRARNACGTGTVGVGTFGEERAVPSDACP